MVIFYAYKLPIEYDAKRGGEVHYTHKFYCETVIFDTLPAMFLALATMLNINKWCYYNLRTRAYQERNKHVTEETKHKLRRNVTILNYITALLCTSVVAPYCYFYVKGCDGQIYFNILHEPKYNEDIMKPSYDFTCIVFATLFILFSIVSVHMILTLKQLVPKLYDQYKVYLWSGSFTLTMPLLLRFVLDLLYNDDASWRKWLFSENHPNRDTDYVLLDFLFTTYIPILS
jgi:hypothetical protein